MRGDLTALNDVGVPYTKDDIDRANDDLKAQANPDADSGDMLKRYPKAQARDFDGDPGKLTEMDALVARSEEQTSELQSQMRSSYAVFVWKKKKKDNKR